jgi:hypothetical protein
MFIIRFSWLTMVVFSFCILLILSFAACCLSSILLCASMKQSLWFFCCGASCAFAGSFLFCSNDLFSFFCSLRIIDGGNGIDLVSATCGVFFCVGCTDLSRQHAFHSLFSQSIRSFSSQSIQFSHSSIISSSVVYVWFAFITRLMCTGRFILEYFSALLS